MALKRNKTLKKLDLRQNPVGENGHGEFLMVKKATKREIQVDPINRGDEGDGSTSNSLNLAMIRAENGPDRLRLEARKLKFGVIKITEFGVIANRYAASESQCFKSKSSRKIGEKAYGAEFIGESVPKTTAEKNVGEVEKVFNYLMGDFFNLVWLWV